jgi:hypothetical protein
MFLLMLQNVHAVKQYDSLHGVAQPAVCHHSTARCALLTGIAAICTHLRCTPRQRSAALAPPPPAGCLAQDTRTAGRSANNHTGGRLQQEYNRRQLQMHLLRQHLMLRQLHGTILPSCVFKSLLYSTFM